MFIFRFYLFIVVAVEFDSVGFVTFAAGGSVEWHIQRLLWLRQRPGFPHGLPNRKGNFDRDCNPWWRKPKAIGKRKKPLWVIVFVVVNEQETKRKLFPIRLLSIHQPDLRWFPHCREGAECTRPNCNRVRCNGQPRPLTKGTEFHAKQQTIRPDWRPWPPPRSE